MKHAHFYNIVDELIVLCQKIEKCLHTERRALVEFSLENLLQNNLQKESFVAELVSKKAEMENYLKAKFGSPRVSNLTESLEGDERQLWMKKKLQWDAHWDRTRELCQRNQKFIRSSQENLDAMTNHLKKLMSQDGTYTQKGVRTERGGQGRVVEGEY